MNRFISKLKIETWRSLISVWKHPNELITLWYSERLFFIPTHWRLLSVSFLLVRYRVYLLDDSRLIINWYLSNECERYYALPCFPFFVSFLVSLLVPFTFPSSRPRLSPSSPQPKKTSLINTAVFPPYIPLVEICYDISRRLKRATRYWLFLRAIMITF